MQLFCRIGSMSPWNFGASAASRPMEHRQARTVTFRRRISEIEFQTQLYAARGFGAGNHTKIRTVERRIRVIEVYQIKGIEELRAELQITALGDGKVLEHRHIQVVQWRSRHDVAACVSERELCRRRKRRLVEPASRSGVADCRITNQIRTLSAGAAE